MDVEAHWQEVYEQKAPDQVSWFEALPEQSLALIEEAEVDRGAALIDVGGGESRLAGELLDRGYTDVTVADISTTALEKARSELGDRAGAVDWIAADVRRHDFGRQFDLWHDRAVFHFLVDEADRDRYLHTLRISLRPGGHLMLATFGPDGPTLCSGLPVHRYGEEELLQTLGQDFALISSRLDMHRTPSGTYQQFLYLHLRRELP
jgi:SAM-dependent methyltransferase